MIPAMGAPSRFAQTAEFRQVCKWVNPGSQAVEVAELESLRGVLTLLILRFSVAGLRTQSRSARLGLLSLPPAQSTVES